MSSKWNKLKDYLLIAYIIFILIIIYIWDNKVKPKLNKFLKNKHNETKSE